LVTLLEVVELAEAFPVAAFYFYQFCVGKNGGPEVVELLFAGVDTIGEAIGEQIKIFF
jgi:hypothetical protein